MQRSYGFAFAALLAGAAAAAVACSGEITGDVAPTASAEDEQPLRDLYVVVPRPTVSSETESYLAASGPPPRRTLFLNRNGGTYTKGTNDSSTNRSSIVDSTVTIGAYAGSDADWAAVRDCVAEQFADWNVEVTDVDPGAKQHIEIVVGGKPGDLGYGGNVGGVAPLYGDCTVVERAIGFVFSDIYKNRRSLCETIAHEIGHTVGLDHEYLCEDPMTYLFGCGQKLFQDVDARCGEYEARDCRCGPTQNSVSVLTVNLGPAESSPPPPPPPPPPPTGDTTPPAVAIAAPADGAVLPPNGPIEVSATASDDASLADVVLVWLNSGSTVEMSCAAPPAGVTCDRAGDLHTFRFEVGSGERSFSFRARDAAGNTAVTETRTISLADAEEPPPDRAPEVTVDSPAPGATVARGGVVQVRATAADDGVVEQAWVTWVYPGGEAIYYLYDLGGGRWGVDLRLSASAVPGGRAVRVTAVDDAGNQTTTADVAIEVVP